MTDRLAERLMGLLWTAYAWLCRRWRPHLCDKCGSRGYLICSTCDYENHHRSEP